MVIGVVADNPGAGAFLLPMIQKIKEENLAELYLLAAGKSLEIWRQNGFTVQDTSVDNKEEQVMHFTNKLDILIAGMSAKSYLGDNWTITIEDITSAYAKNKIPVIRTQDLWGTGCDDRTLHGDVFCVIDKQAADILAPHLTDNQKIVVTGDPRWDKLLENDLIKARRKTREKVAILDNEILISYVGRAFLPCWYKLKCFF